MTQLTIALFQNDSAPLDTTAQADALTTAAETASLANAKLLITPELFMSGYKIPGRVEGIAEPIGGPFMIAVEEIARAYRIAILYGYPEQCGEQVFNSAALIDDTGSLVLNHRKLHLSGPYEKSSFQTDNNRVEIAEIGGIKVAPLICYDVEFPEAVRAAAMSGAQLVAVPTALVEQFEFLTRTLIPTRAFENGIFVAYTNHAGTEADLQYCGHSTVAQPDGSFVQCEGSGEDLLVTTIDTALIDKCRDRLPYLADRRSDLLSDC